MSAPKETVVDRVSGTTTLCNVPSIAVDLKLSVAVVKQFFPLEGADSITTGVNDGDFVVHLRPSTSTSEGEQLIPAASIWSSHGYQKLPQEQISIAERNSRYLSLLDERPDPVISSETAPRKLDQSAAVSDVKTEKKASSAEFFNNNSTPQNGIKSKKSPVKREPQNMFQRKPKTEASKDIKTEVNAKVESAKKEADAPKESKTSKPQTKNGDKAAEKNSKKEAVSSEAKESRDEEKAHPTEPEVTKKTKSPKAESKKSSKSVKEESEAKASKSKKEAAADEGARKSIENKRKRIGETSDDEEVTRSSRGKKKLKRVAILDSDSDEGGDDENKASEDTPENAEEETMDTSESPVKKTKKTKSKPDKPDSDQKTNGSTSKKTAKKTSPLKGFTKKVEKDVSPESEKKSSSQDDKTNGSQQRRRRRVLKEVTHTFKSEDGFLETKTVKEMVSETDSEPEDGNTSKNSKSKATPKPPAVAKTPAPAGQASLLSFFKKK